jgi:hypothetical protein
MRQNARNSQARRALVDVVPKPEISIMTNEEKTSLKAACLQAATTLIAARDSTRGVVDVDECVKLAAELYCRVTVNRIP